MMQGAHLTADVNAKNLLEKIVCSTERETCTLIQCESHPDSHTEVTLYNGQFLIWR
jgi:hypothetical protein